MSKVQTLPPTDAIKDPEVRAFCEALSNAWNLRNGNINVGEEERFITKGELTDATLNALADALGASFAPGGPPIAGVVPPGGKLPTMTPNPTARRIDELLRERITLLSIPANADMRARVANAESGMLSTKNVQATRDFALASAVNTIWATVGNASTAIIQDGALARATPVVAEATQWNQVQSVITDPATGAYVYTAAVREDFNTYASATDGKLSATWTIRINAGNRIAGIGLGITGDANTPPTSSFNIIADQFWVTDPDGTLADSPFSVQTNAGTWGPPGVYIKDAFITNGAITNAKIGNVIYSDTYYSSGGTQGWMIDKNGTAVFNNITARGNITANSVTANTITAGNLQAGSVGMMGVGAGSAGIGNTAGIHAVLAIATVGPLFDNEGHPYPQYVAVTISDGGGVIATGDGYGTAIASAYCSGATSVSAAGGSQTIIFGTTR